MRVNVAVAIQLIWHFGLNHVFVVPIRDIITHI